MKRFIAAVALFVAAIAAAWTLSGPVHAYDGCPSGLDRMVITTRVSSWVWSNSGSGWGFGGVSVTSGNHQMNVYTNSGYRIHQIWVEGEPGFYTFSNLNHQSYSVYFNQTLNRVRACIGPNTQV